VDFTDALHLTPNTTVTEFVTFDRDMINCGKRLGLPVIAP
jgi:predicted nucleic-acid-binding protein